MTTETLIPPAEELARSARAGSRPPYACPQCGHRLRVSGVGRHRVYFEFDDERSDDPVMNGICPVCGHGLPGKS